jgi:hypothetical protein
VTIAGEAISAETTTTSATTSSFVGKNTRLSSHQRSDYITGLKCERTMIQICSAKDVYEIRLRNRSSVVTVKTNIKMFAFYSDHVAIRRNK